MALEPGNLSELDGAGQEAWDEWVGKAVNDLKNASAHWVAPDDASLGSQPTAVDWGGFPQRLETCLGLRRTMELLDWRAAQGDLGRAVGQEEYLEWRSLSGADGKLRRVELTTEVQEYWATLAAHHPVKVLRLAGRFAGEESAPWQAVFGELNPFAPNVSAKQRKRAFESQMLALDGPARSPYNNGTKAICFLSQSVNSLTAAVGLAEFGGLAYAKRVGGQLAHMTAPEAIASTNTQAAVDCRSSDPTIVEVLIRLAWDGRKMALHDPLGIYILDVDTSRLALRDGSPVPREWFDFQRGAKVAVAPGGVGLSQRLVVEVPPGMGFTLGDIIDTSLDEPVRFGGQIARLVRVGLYVRLAPSGSIAVNPIEHALAPVPPCGGADACGQWTAFWNQFEATLPVAGVAAPARLTRRGRK